MVLSRNPVGWRPSGRTSHHLFTEEASLPETGPYIRKWLAVVIGLAILLGVTLTIAAVATPASSAAAQVGPPNNYIPIQPSFVNPPWVYEWDQLVTYRLKLTPNHVSQMMLGEVHFQGFAIDQSGMLTKTVVRRFSMKPGDKPMVIRIRYAMPAAVLSLPIDQEWCVDATLWTEGVPQQMARTCAQHDSGK